MISKSAIQVMIAGCGPVGLTLANCLVRSPYINSIVLLDRKVPSDSRQIPQNANQRVYSINGPSLKIFENLNIMPSIRQKGVMSSIQVASKQSLSFVNWKQNKANIIQNDELVYALIKSLKSSEYQKKITFIQDQVSSINVNTSSCEVHLKNQKNKKIDVKLIVGSDGIYSSIKNLSSISHYGWQYRQKAIVCTMKSPELSPSNNTSAYQIYHDGNVLAFLPLWDNYISLVWSLGLPDFQYLSNVDDKKFVEKLNNVVRNCNNYLGSQQSYMKMPQISQIVNKRLSFPLSTMQSSQYTKNRIALVGDAAHTIHPMAGLGVNSGIMDSLLLANNIIKNIKSGNDIGQLIALSQYESKAKAFNYANSIAMQSIKKLFESDNWVSNKVRSIGMNFAQNSSLLKQTMKNVVDRQNLQFQWASL